MAAIFRQIAALPKVTDSVHRGRDYSIKFPARRARRGLLSRRYPALPLKPRSLYQTEPPMAPD